MRLLRLLTAALFFLTAQFLPAVASAAPTVGPIYEWSNESARGNRLSTEISRADCVADASVKFSIEILDTAGSFEVWAGSGCNEPDNRTQGQCFKVAEAALTVDTITLRVQDMMQTPSESAGPGLGTAAVCDRDDNQTGAIDLYLFFLLINKGTEESTGGSIKFTYDITPPPPPADISAGPGEDSLEVSFTESKAEDLEGYSFYCSEIGPPPEQGAGGAGEAVAAPSGDCTSSVLVPGEDVPSEGVIACGSADSAQATDGTATGLVNGTRYAVAVSARDKFDNVGKLSALACGTPQEVTGFFEAYRAAGGQGGGGFCSFGPPRRGAIAAGLALLLAGAVLLRRRK
jgi:hypothetical protein